MTLAHKLRELWISAGIGLLCLAVSAIVAIRIGHKVTRPIANLAHAMEGLGKGDLDVRVTPSSMGELQTLEHGINEMAARLEEAQQTLQRRVEEATQELTRQKEEAERANRAKSRFLAAASHDLRQPMHALILFVTALKERIQYPEVSKIVQNIESSVIAMLGLFNALLDISRLDAGVLHPNPVSFEIQTLLQRLQIEFAPQAIEKRLKFRVFRSSAVVHSDPVLLERVLMNLISNAIRYTSEGGVLVGCRRRRGKVRIEVWDTGPGIPVDRREDIFQEFYQLGNPERDRNKGLGLGLAIVERMTHLLETRIELDSVEGKGSVFAFEIARAVVRRAKLEPVKRTPFAGSSLQGILIVVVDDESAILEGMQGLLQEWGCVVVTAGSGREALNKIACLQRVPDVIISDYRLREEETGVGVIRDIRAAVGSQVAGILITGDTAPDRLREAEASGYQLQHKPVRPAKLRALLTHLVSAGKEASASHQ